MSDQLFETKLTTVPAQDEAQANPCFECGNCCKNVYGSLTLKEVLYFIERGTEPYICMDLYQYESIKDDPTSYPSNIYIYSESLEESLSILLDYLPYYSQEEIEEFHKIEVEVLIVGNCINFDPEARKCTDYENRPELCSGLETGSDLCNNIRKTNSLDVIPLTAVSSTPIID